MTLYIIRAQLYSQFMDLLRRGELPAWLLARFSSANALSKELNVTRQTAHNLLTGRTIPSYETCEKLGLDPVFLLQPPEARRKMSTLDDFLRDRRERGVADDLKARLLRERGPAMWDELKQAVQTTATRVGRVDGNALEWNPFPFLKLQYVAATFTPGMFVGGVPTGCRIVIGRIPTALYVDDNPLPSEVWELSLGVNGNQLVWDVKGEDIVGISTLGLAEQIVRRLIEYRDAYQDACSKALR